jgi:hypothetical protein
MYPPIRSRLNLLISQHMIGDTLDGGNVRGMAEAT